MDKYITQTISYTDFQKDKIKNACRKNTGVVIQLSNTQLFGKNDKILLTSKQAENVDKARLTKKGIRLEFSRNQLKSCKEGGFLPFLPIIGVLASIAGGTAGIVSAVNNVNKNQKELTEMKRHNDIVESALLKRGGRLKKTKK